MKTPTLAALKKLAKRKGWLFESYRWKAAEGWTKEHLSLSHPTKSSAGFDGYSHKVPIREAIQAALNALPDAKPKGAKR